MHTSMLTLLDVLSMMNILQGRPQCLQTKKYRYLRTYILTLKYSINDLVKLWFVSFFPFKEVARHWW